MNRLAHNYVVGATSGTALIVAAVVAFVLLVSLQTLQERSGLPIGLGGSDGGAPSAPAKTAPPPAARQATSSGSLSVSRGQAAQAQTAAAVTPARRDRVSVTRGNTTAAGEHGAGRLSSGAPALNPNAGSNPPANVAPTPPATVAPTPPANLDSTPPANVAPGPRGESTFPGRTGGVDQVGGQGRGASGDGTAPPTYSPPSDVESSPEPPPSSENDESSTPTEPNCPDGGSDSLAPADEGSGGDALHAVPATTPASTDAVANGLDSPPVGGEPVSFGS